MVAGRAGSHDEPMATEPPPAPPRDPAPPWYRSLHRSREQRWFGGVAGGIAETYRIDVRLVRIAFVITAFFGGFGLLVYGVAWLLLPEEGTGNVGATDTSTTAYIGGLAVAMFGALVLFDKVFSDNDVLDFMWPVALVVIGVAVMVSHVREREDAQLGPELDTTDEEPDSDAPTAATTAPLDETRGATDTAWTQSVPWPTMPRPPRHPRRRRHRPFLGPIVVSVLFVYAGVAALLDATDVVEVNAQVALAMALVVVGAGLFMSAWFGRAHGLIALGLLLSIPLTALAIVDVPLEGGAGERTYRPATAADVKDEYRLVAGQLTIDLVDTPLGRTTDIEASVAFGELRVFVPDGITVEVDAHAGAGDINVFGIEEGGISIDNDRIVDGGEGASTLRLDLEVGMGSIHIERIDDDGFETQLRSTR